jgi:hypothetical protein
MDINNLDAYMVWLRRTYSGRELTGLFIKVLSDNKLNIPENIVEDDFCQTSFYVLSYIIAHNSDISLDAAWVKFCKQCEYIETLTFEKCNRCDSFGQVKNKDYGWDDRGVYVICPSCRGTKRALNHDKIDWDKADPNNVSIYKALKNK